MRAQCCICSDLFENDESVNIAAAPCGHTFHEVCLMRWLDSSATCPSCRISCRRNQVIRKLYFDADEIGEATNEDPSTLINQVADLKAKVRQRDKEKAELQESKTTFQNRIENILREKELVDKQFKKEQNINTALKKQISSYEAQQKYVQSEKEEYRKSVKSLKDLQHLQVMLTGCDSEAQVILNQYGDGSSCTQQLSRYCAILKREYEQIKLKKKTCIDQIDKLRREIITKDRQLKEKTQENTVLTEHLTRSEEDLKNTEKEKEVYRKKLNHLKKVVRSPGAASSSFVETLTEDSPMTSVFTPDRDKRGHIPEKALLLTPDLFDCPDSDPDTPNTQAKQHCDRNNIKYVKIVSASESQPTKRPRIESDPCDLKTLGTLNIFKKKNVPGNFSSAIQKGYDGFGGHTNFVKPLGVRNNGLLRKKKSSSTSSVAQMFAKKTPLPSLNNFIEID